MNPTSLFVVILSGSLAMAHAEDTQIPTNTEFSEKGDHCLNQQIPGNINYATEVKHSFVTAVDCGAFGHVPEPCNPTGSTKDTKHSGTDSPSKLRTYTTTTTTTYSGSTVITTTCNTTVTTASNTTASPTTASPTTAKAGLSCPDEAAYVQDPQYTITKNKWTTQSSTNAYNTLDYGAHLAVDGDIKTSSYTARGRQDLTPWWSIDLREAHIIVGFSIRNRDSESWRLHDFEVRVGPRNPKQNPKDMRKNPLCHFHEGGGIGSGETFRMNCLEPILGRHLSIQIIKNCTHCPEPEDNYLIMSEVYIYGCKP